MQFKKYYNQSNLFIAKENKDMTLGVMDRGRFTPLSSKLGDSKLIYVYGLYSIESALNNLFRVSAMALVDKVNKELDIHKYYSRNFVNGGTYANGTFVQEAVIYVPYLGEPRAIPGLAEYQAVFTFHPLYKEVTSDTRFNAPIVEIQGKKLAFDGMALTENAMFYFSHVLKPIEISLEKYPERIVQQEFPDIYSDDVPYFLVSIDSHEWWGLIEIAAELIKKYYFDGNTYNGQRKNLLEKLRS